MQVFIQSTVGFVQGKGREEMGGQPGVGGGKDWSVGCFQTRYD